MTATAFLDSVPVENLAGGMALLAYGEWHHVIGAYTDDEHVHAEFAEGEQPQRTAIRRGEEVWAFPDWALLESIAKTLPETGGTDDTEGDDER